MSKAIVICGQSGVGKTTLAKELSRQLDIFCLHKDEIKEPLYELLGGKSLEDSKNIGRYSVELLFRLAENAIQIGVDIIVEAPFTHPSNPERFIGWKRDHDADIYIIVCNLADDTERAKRKGDRERHYAHHDNDRSPERDHPDYSLMPNPKLVLDMSKSTETLLREVLEFIG